MAIVLDEAGADAGIAALEGEQDVLVSALTIAEAVIVRSHRGVDRPPSGEPVEPQPGVGHRARVLAQPAAAERVIERVAELARIVDQLGVAPYVRPGRGLA